MLLLLLLLRRRTMGCTRLVSRMRGVRARGRGVRLVGVRGVAVVVVVGGGRRGGVVVVVVVVVMHVMMVVVVVVVVVASGVTGRVTVEHERGRRSAGRGGGR